MAPFTRLQELARGASRNPGTALDQVLALACELLRMDHALIGTIGDDVCTVHRAVGLDSQREPSLETTSHGEHAFCRPAAGQAATLVSDTAGHHELAGPLQAYGARAYAGICLGRTVGPAGSKGFLGLVRATPHDRLGSWEAEVLEGLAPVVAELWAASMAGGDEDIKQVQAQDVAGLTRPLLDALHEMSGLATAFLCRVDKAADSMEVLLVHRSEQAPDIREGATFAWTDSLCSRAQADGTPAVTDASQRWPDSSAGVALGLLTHATVPVELSDGTLWGTLCASDVVVHEDVAEHVPTLRLFARLIAAEVERHAGLAAERRDAAEARRRSFTDELTGAASRSSVQPWLAAAKPSTGSAFDEGAADRHSPGAGRHVALAFIDVDRFKAVNDVHGHATGDAVLVELVRRLQDGARSADLVARIGGDEFVVAAHLPDDAVAAFEARVTRACAFEMPVAQGSRVQVRCSIGFVSSKDVREDEILAVADRRMYRDKSRPSVTPLETAWQDAYA